MKVSKTFRGKVLASFLGAGLVASSTTTTASVEGPGTFNGDFWQGMLEIVLSLPSAAEFIDKPANIDPYQIPRAKSHGLTTFRNQSIEFELKAKHLTPEGEVDQNLTWSIVEPPLHGRIEGIFPHMTYIPEADYTGFDKIVFKVDDKADGSTEGTIDIKVQGSYTAFESGQVRPLALSSDSKTLYALNTPDGKLEIFDVSGSTPTLKHSVPVGLEPVAISLLNDAEAWVVNTLSDSVSVVNLAAATPYVKRTIHVGDEPQDIVFAGPNRQRAFITTAHRGQHSPSDMAPFTPGIGRADVWVFDAASGSNDPINVVNLFGMQPRGLAVSPDGKWVYAAIYKSGNKSTIIAHNYDLYGKKSTLNGKPGPKTDAGGTRAPNTGLIAKYDGNDWRDFYGTKWNNQVFFDLPDQDVFEIDAMADKPKVRRNAPGVGNALFNMAVNPKTGVLYVSNLEARNELKFEGFGERSDVQTLTGRFIENRITVINNKGVYPRNINPHLRDERPLGSEEDNAKSLALPLEMVVDSSGQNLYVAAYGSSKIGVFKTLDLEIGTHKSSEENHIEVSGGGPAGLVLDEANKRMFVLTRFDNSISVIDMNTQKEVQHVAMYNPEPDFIVEGRPFLYDARYSSGRGDSACGSCHLFGDMDGIAWDLGNPDISWSYNPREYTNFFMKMNALRIHHPLKGPMLTQSLRGMEMAGPQHWRGDRTGKERYHGESLERAAFKEFIVAFPELLGMRGEPTEEEMDKFADFALQLRYPPNPNRNLDDTNTESAQRGADTFFNVKTTGFEAENTGNVAMIACNDCHEVNPEIERFGSNTLMSFEGTETTQDMKVAHLRNVYTRIGMFGQKFREPTSTSKQMGNQVTAYGLSHDGAVDTLESFLSINVFHVPTKDIPDVLDFVVEMPTGLAPIVGQQVTLSASQQGDSDLIDLMVSQALAHTKADGPNKQQCDLVVQGVVDGEYRGWMMNDSGAFLGDNGESSTDESLRALALQAGNQLTYLCAPPGTGYRIALDRDEDGLLNGRDTQIAGKADTSVQPANPNAEPVFAEIVDPETGGFQREESQKERGTWPDFDDFWAF